MNLDINIFLIILTLIMTLFVMLDKEQFLGPSVALFIISILKIIYQYQFIHLYIFFVIISLIVIIIQKSMKLISQ